MNKTYCKKTSLVHDTSVVHDTSMQLSGEILFELETMLVPMAAPAIAVCKVVFLWLCISWIVLML